MARNTPLPYPIDSITGGILAGGQGSRLGGVDKGWVDYQEQPLIKQVIARLQPQVSQLIINSNRSQTQYRALGYRLVSDAEQGFHGPLMGISALLDACTTPWLLIAPCDGPYLPERLAEKLWQAADQQQAHIAVAKDAKRKQPAYALIQQSLADDLRVQLAAGERKIMAWYQQHPHCFVEFDDSHFVNINTPDDLAAQK